jgi:glycerophosphoryl diester phosphodiesterase
MTSRFLIYATPFLLLFIGLSLFEPYLYRNFFASTKIEPLKGKEFLVIAHKGASKQAPENTIAAIQRALDLRVDMIEIDVRFTEDEELIVFHDETLDRVARDSAGHHIKGKVEDWKLADIKKLDVGSWFATPYADQRIPTLKEVLDLVNAHNQEFNDDVIVLCEIKHMDHPHYHDFAEKIVQVIKSEPNGEAWIYVQSYENEYLQDIHELDSLVQTKQLLIGEDSAPLISFYVETRMHMGHAKVDNRMKALNPEFSTLSPRRIFRMHARGYEVYTYPVNTRDDMIKMLNAGVDGIITDDPETLIELRDDIRALK